MTTLLIAGLATLDFVFDVDGMPTRAEKHRARDADMFGGGGAANAAVAAARLGGRPMLAARLGDDVLADLIVSGLEREGVDTSLTARMSGRKSSFSAVLVDPAGERLIVNYRDVATAGRPDFSGVTFDAALSDTRWPEGAEALMLAARAIDRPGVMDAEAPVGIASAAIEAASHVAFSAQGLRDFTGIDDFHAALAATAARTGAWVCVTDGTKGAFWLEDGRLVNEPAFLVEAVETLAAGDVWHAAFALALGEGREEVSAVRFANAAAAVKCGRRGGRASYATRAEVDALLGDAP